MLNLFYFECELLYGAAQAWLVLQLADALFQPARTGKRKYMGQALLIALMAAAHLGNAICNGAMFSDALPSNILLSGALFIAGILIMAIGNIVLHICSIPDAFCLSTLGLSALALADIIVRTLISLILNISVRFNDISSATPERGVYLLVWTAVMIPGGLALGRWIAARRLELLEYRKTWPVLMLPILLSIICFQMFPSQLQSGWAVFLLCCILLFLALWLNTVKHGAENENKMLQMRFSMLADNYQGLMELTNERAILVHDTKNHLRTISTMLAQEKPDEAKAYISQITAQLEGGKDMVWSNHEMLNLVLNMKFREAKKAQIQVECQCDDMSGLALSSVEICALFSNLLDNAIEANKKCPAGMERRISLLCARREKMLMISLSNSMAKEPKSQEHRHTETAGQDRKLHGFGMRSIRKVVDSYHGNMKMDMRDNEFSTVIYLAAFEGQASVK